MRDNVKSGALTEVTFYILLSLYSPKHGYAVMQFIEEKTGGRLSLGAGTLYGALNSMQEKGWIELFGDSEGRKKEYLITVKGNAHQIVTSGVGLFGPNMRVGTKAEIVVVNVDFR